MPPVVLHHLENSRSTRIIFLFEELGMIEGTDYEIRHYKRDPKTRLAPPELREVHPLGKAPVVVLEDGTVVAESAAIVEHFVKRKGASLAPDAKDEVLHSSLLHFCEGTLMVHMTKPTIQAMAGRNIDLDLAYLESVLGSQEFFVSNKLTGVDVMLIYSIDGAVTAQPGQFKKLEAWRERIQARPGWQKALEKGGALDFGAFQPKL